MKSTVEQVERVGLVANPEKVTAARIIQQAVRVLHRQGKTVVCEAGAAALAKLHVETFEGTAAVARHCDLLLVFGGDGTMLSAARAAVGLGTPLLGVNIGGLGFLTAMPAGRMARELPKVCAGEFSIEERSMIEVRGRAANQRITQLALNDFVISRGSTSRLIELEVKINGEVLTRYRCDGLIVSSPTGSTAYSLAAGGAVVSPSARVFTLTPICPHTLSNRSVIVGLDSVIEVTVAPQKLEVFLTADGQVQLPISPGDSVQIRRGGKSIRLARLPGSSFFETLRQKLHWSGSNL